VELFRQQQTRLNGIVTIEDKSALRARFAALENELCDFLAAEHGVKQTAVAGWKQSQKPFHWLVDFHRIMAGGGFDVIIGNPPYIELKEVDTSAIRNYKCFDAGNLYAVMAGTLRGAGADLGASRLHRARFFYQHGQV